MSKKKEKDVEWKCRLEELRHKLPNKLAERKHLSRKEVIAQKQTVYVRVSDNIVRKTHKSI